MVIMALFTSRKTQIPAFFYMGIGGLVILCVAAVPNLRLAKDIVIGLGLFSLGWGFARALTVDNQQLSNLSIFRLFPKQWRSRFESPPTSARPSRSSRKESLIGAVGLVLAGLALWYLRPGYSTSAYIFLLFGVQLLAAALIFLGQK